MGEETHLIIQSIKSNAATGFSMTETNQMEDGCFRTWLTRMPETTKVLLEWEHIKAVMLITQVLGPSELILLQLQFCECNKHVG